MTEATASETKLYANKFKTVEDLEAGYNNAAKVYQENESLKKKFEEVTKIPDEYMTPSDVVLENTDVAEIKAIAKSSSLTQAQYEKLIKESHSRVVTSKNAFETAKKEIGADNLNIIQDFVKKQYGEKVSNTLMNSIITNKELREEILSQRQSALNSATPGMGRASGSGYHEVTHKDVMAARDQMTKSRGKAQVEARNHYLSLQKRIAAQKSEKTA